MELVVTTSIGLVQGGVGSWGFWGFVGSSWYVPVRPSNPVAVSRFEGFKFVMNARVFEVPRLGGNIEIGSHHVGLVRPLKNTFGVEHVALLQPYFNLTSAQLQPSEFPLSMTNKNSKVPKDERTTRAFQQCRAGN